MFNARKSSLRQQADDQLLQLAYYLREDILSYQEVDALAADKAPKDTYLLLQKAKYDFIYRQLRRRKVRSKEIAPDMFR